MQQTGRYPSGQTAEVTGTGALGISANAAGEIREAPLLWPPGYAALPSAGDTAALLPMEDYLVCAGVVAGPPEGDDALLPGEIRLRAASGAEIDLRADGSIRLNGLVIGADGQIQTGGGV